MLIVMFRHFITCALFLLPLSTAQADPAQMPPPPVTLAQAMARVQAPTHGIALVVGADAITLPDMETAPVSGISISDCADLFAMSHMEFGAVTAIAPASMVVFNNYPGTPDLSSSFGPGDALKQLAATLDDTQWNNLFSERGLGLSDLNASQQTLWWAMFPSRELKIVPKVSGGLPSGKIEPTDLTGDLPEARVCVGQRVIMFGNSMGGGMMFVPDQSPPGAPLQWTTVSVPKPPDTSLYGSQVRAEIANQPKRSDLKFNLPALQTPIAFAGVETVGELVNRIGFATGLELYADPHYAGYTVTILGTDKSAPARDLLQALALCVAGTYRNVGRAYVLTNDLVGLAQTREIWQQYLQAAEYMMRQSRDQAQLAVYRNHPNAQPPSFGDPMAMSKAEEAPGPNDKLARFIPWAHLNMFPYAKLTSGQQDAAKRIADTYAATHAARIARDPKMAPNVNGTWTLQPIGEAQVIVPGFPQPINLSNAGAGSLTMPPLEVMNQALKNAEDWLKHNQKESFGKPLPPVSELLKSTPRRALLAAPQSPDQVKSLMATMHKLGLNELWLTVFSKGVACVPGTPFPQPLNRKDDLLSVALDAAKGSGIAVYPVIDLLTWGAAAPDSVRDYNVVGEDSVQIATRQAAAPRPTVDPDHVDKPPAGLSVSPFAPKVGADLTALVKMVAAHPGVAGLIGREAAPPGYTGYRSFGESDNALGYTESARLAFLRAYHADPLDIDSPSSVSADLSLPLWKGARMPLDLSSAWTRYRADADKHLMRSLYQTIQLAAPPGANLPILLESGDQKRFEGGIIPPGPWPADGSWPQAKPESIFETIPIPPGCDMLDLQWALHSSVGARNATGYVLGIAPSDGGLGADEFERLAAKIAP